MVLAQHARTVLCAATLCGAMLIAGNALQSVLANDSAGTPRSQKRLLTQKLQLIDALLDRTRRREDLGNDASATLEVAETLANVARGDVERGEFSTARVSLDESIRLIGEVSRRSAPASTEQQRQAYEDLRSTILGLRDAFSVVVEHKGEKAAALLDTQALERDLDQAEDHASLSRYQRATVLLKQAYRPLVQALSSARASETVEYRLSFDSPEAEFDYEQRRYRSNLLLLDLMVQERTPGASALARIDAARSHAEKLHVQAVDEAAADDVARAIKTSEQAVRHLEEALRHTGIFYAR